VVGFGDGLSAGWFDDRSALVPAGLWALLLFVIWQLTRRGAVRPIRDRVASDWRRRAAVTAVCLVAAVPFIASLFWFYATVARLLPAGV
jgi:hypothetical protein